MDYGFVVPASHQYRVLVKQFDTVNIENNNINLCQVISKIFNTVKTLVEKKSFYTLFKRSGNF